MTALNGQIGVVTRCKRCKGTKSRKHSSHIVKVKALQGEVAEVRAKRRCAGCCRYYTVSITGKAPANSSFAWDVIELVKDLYSKHMSQREVAEYISERHNITLGISSVRNILDRVKNAR